MSRTDQPDSPPPEWEPCAPGEVARLGKKLRGRKTRRVFLRAAVAAASAVVTGGGVWLAFGHRRGGEYDYGGIVCSEVVRQGADYMAGKVPEPTRSQIAEHVARCPRCGPLFKQMREQMDQMG
ncbi:unnamed protein product [Gemmataceae bacterium]|jgi:hypothetical protein|nr:unnamed protein product [Gemmataceae bacterium]VTT99540.1 unnamed protein product [Gemmataceae bacterium]